MRIYITQNKNNAFERCLDIESKTRKIILNSKEIAYKNFGKPYFSKYPDIQFNISHSNNIWVCAIDDNYEVGIDVEKKRRVNNAEKIALRFFHKKEANYVCSFPDSFLLIWTIKESYVKCIGEGISKEFNKFSVVENDEVIKSLNGYYFCGIVFCDYIIMVCTIENIFNMHLIWF